MFSILSDRARFGLSILFLVISSSIRLYRADPSAARLVYRCTHMTHCCIIIENFALWLLLGTLDVMELVGVTFKISCRIIFNLCTPSSESTKQLEQLTSLNGREGNRRISALPIAVLRMANRHFGLDQSVCVLNVILWNIRRGCVLNS